MAIGSLVDVIVGGLALTAGKPVLIGVALLSLVYFRPVLMAFVPLYGHELARRHPNRHSQTALARISGRVSMIWDALFQLDVWYVDNWSLWLDVKIVLRSLHTVVRREGVSSEGLGPLPGYDPGTQR